MNPEEKRIRILQALLEVEKDGASSVPDESELAAMVGFGPQGVRDQLDILEAQGAVSANRTFGGHYAPLLTGHGKYVLEQQLSARPVEVSAVSESCTQIGQAFGTREWDVFIAHASEDKMEFVRPLAECLRRQGIRVWYDEYTLSVGDSLRRSIDDGFARSSYGVVVLGPHFFAKAWPQKELDGLSTKALTGRRVILPIWRRVTQELVASHSPTLADILALKAEDGIETVSSSIVQGVKGGELLASPSPATDGHPPRLNWIEAYLGAEGRLPALPDRLADLPVNYDRGMPISRGLQLRPLGAQTWERLQPSERQQVRGLVEWLGLSWNDYWNWSTRLWPRSRKATQDGWRTDNR